MAKAGADRFRHMLARNRALAEGFDEPGFPLAELEALQSWQRARFRRSYADFLSSERDRPACHFFLEELYGGLGFRKRDEDVDRVAPVMIRLLPSHALESMADAFRLQALSLELDVGLARCGGGFDPQTMDDAEYARRYRAFGHRPERECQIELIRGLGHRLQRLVETPLLLRLVALMRAPAHAAGFGELQSFLDRGLHAFRQLEDPGRLVEAIYRREREAMERMLDGDENPFADSLRA